MKKRTMSLILATALSCSLLLTACGNSGDSTSGGNASGSNTPSSSVSSGASTSGSNASGYTFRTSESNRVVTENGTFTKEQAATPVLITSYNNNYGIRRGSQPRLFPSQSRSC